MIKNTEETKLETTNNENNLTENKNSKEEKFYTPENFVILRNFQIEIYKNTGFTPSFQKIINSLITEENLKQLELNIINNLKLNNL